jgi:hypothetical protein
MSEIGANPEVSREAEIERINDTLRSLDAELGDIYRIQEGEEPLEESDFDIDELGEVDEEELEERATEIHERAGQLKRELFKHLTDDERLARIRSEIEGAIELMGGPDWTTVDKALNEAFEKTLDEPDVSQGLISGLQAIKEEYGLPEEVE